MIDKTQLQKLIDNVNNYLIEYSENDNRFSDLYNETIRLRVVETIENNIKELTNNAINITNILEKIILEQDKIINLLQQDIEPNKLNKTMIQLDILLKEQNINTFYQYAKDDLLTINTSTLSFSDWFNLVFKLHHKYNQFIYFRDIKIRTCLELINNQSINKLFDIYNKRMEVYRRTDWTIPSDYLNKNLSVKFTEYSIKWKAKTPKVLIENSEVFK